MLDDGTHRIPPEAGVSPAGTRRKTRPEVPLFLRSSENRFGILSNRLPRPLYLLCYGTFLAGTVGWVLLVCHLLGVQTFLSQFVDLAGALVLALAGVAAQYRLVLHRRANEMAEEFPDARHPEARGRLVVLPSSARRKSHPMIRPLLRLQEVMGDRLRRLRGHAAEHLRHRPATDYLTPAEIITCLTFAGLGVWGGVYIAAFCRQPPRVIDFRDLAGACTAVVMGAFLAFRLLMFVLLKLRGRRDVEGAAAAAQAAADAGSAPAASAAAGEPAGTALRSKEGTHDHTSP